MRIRRTIYLFSCVLIVGVGLFMLQNAFIGGKAGNKDVMAKHPQNGYLKKDGADRHSSHFTKDEDKKSPEFVDWETFKQEKGRKNVPFEWTPADVEAEIQRLIKKEEAKWQSTESRKATMEHPEIQQLIRNHRAWTEKRQEALESLKKLQEKLLWRVESMGAILIFDESGNPIGYEKDVYGNPILRRLSSVDEKTPQEPLDQVPTDAQRDNFLSTPQTIIENDKRLPSLDTPPNPSTPEQQISDLTIHTGETFIPDLFQESFISQTLDWNAYFDDQYLDVIVAPYLSREEYEEFYPTEVSRAQLKNRQQQMQADIAERVQRFLETEDTGNRSEKLTIVRETLSENWSPTLAEGVLEQLR